MSGYVFWIRNRDSDKKYFLLEGLAYGKGVAYRMSSLIGRDCL